MRRRWKERIWFYRPDLSIDSLSWKWDLRPVWLGDDEYHWRTLVIGTRFTGHIVIALKQFECDDDYCKSEGYPGWPMCYMEWLHPEHFIEES